jgi:hypothetical protein
MTLIDQALVEKLNSVIGAGLVSGLGSPEPGKVCIEAAICLAFGEKHSDEPICVGGPDRSLSIALNDKNWSSPMARAIGMRRLGIAQLGSAALTPAQRREWRTHIKIGLVRQIVPIALRAAASCHSQKKHRDALNESANKCEQVSDADAADAANYAANAANYAANAANNAANAAANAANAANYAANAAANAANAANYAANAAADAATYAADAATYAADAATYATYAVAKNRDQILTMVCEIVAQAYIRVGCEGAKFLDAYTVQTGVSLTQSAVK